MPSYLAPLQRVAVGAVLAHPDAVSEAGAAEHMAHGGARRGGHGGAQDQGEYGWGGTAHWVLELDYGFKVAVDIPAKFFN